MAIVYIHLTNNAGMPRNVASKVGGSRQSFPSLVYDCGNWIWIGRIEGHFCSAALFWCSWGFFHRTCVIEQSVAQVEPLSATDRLIWPVN